MEIFKPDKKNITPDCIESTEDSFYNYSHGILDCGQEEYTLCGVACEEWEYTKKLPRKKITCPRCLEIIRECKKYKL